MMSKTLTVLSLSLIAQVAFAGQKIQFIRGSIDPVNEQARLLKNVAVDARTEFIVQFKAAVSESTKSFLASQGLEVFGYLPDDSLVVRGTKSQLDQLASNGSVRSYIPYAAEYKVSPAFDSMMVARSESPLTAVVRVFKANDSERVKHLIQKLSLDILMIDSADRLIVISTPQRLLLKIADLAGVEHIGPTQEMVSFHAELGADVDSSMASAGDYTDLKGDETGTKVMNFAPAWAMGYTGKNEIASMADTGLDTGDLQNIHADFQGALKTGHIFGLFSKSWGDPMGHGTHVAGSIVGRGTLSGGALKGGAFEAQFIPQGIWSPMMKNLSLPSKLASLFDKAYADGARIHSNSWGGAQTFGAYDSYARQVDEWNFAHQDMTILFAAGNSGIDANKDGRIDENSMSSPGTAKNCVTVGASENVTQTGGIQVPISKLRTGKDSWGAEPIFSSLVSDNANGMAMFSSRGPTEDGRIKPDVSAPGTNILSTRSSDKASSPLWGAYNDFYAWSGGTSMATPLTAGAATVMRQYLRQEAGIQSPSAALVKAALMHTAVDMFPGQYGARGAANGQELLTVRPNSDEGYGRVDVSGILNLKNSLVIDDVQGVAKGSERSFDVQLNGGKILANLVYTDAPGSENVKKSLVNDLDLVLVDSQGKEIGSMDRTNNHEIIEMSGLKAGKYRLVVRGFNVPSGIQGKQPFALIVTSN